MPDSLLVSIAGSYSNESLALSLASCLAAMIYPDNPRATYRSRCGLCRIPWELIAAVPTFPLYGIRNISLKSLVFVLSAVRLLEWHGPGILRRFAGSRFKSKDFDL